VSKVVIAVVVDRHPRVWGMLHVFSNDARLMA